MNNYLITSSTFIQFYALPVTLKPFLMGEVRGVMSDPQQVLQGVMNLVFVADGEVWRNGAGTENCKKYVTKHVSNGGGWVKYLIVGECGRELGTVKMKTV